MAHERPEAHPHDVPIGNVEDMKFEHMNVQNKNFEDTKFEDTKFEDRDKDREALEFDPPGSIEEGVILEFDEGDALFGKRTGVKDSHDRS